MIIGGLIMANKNIAWLENNIAKAEKIVEAKREQAI